jgi:hypothetical protein
MDRIIVNAGDVGIERSPYELEKVNQIDLING